MEPKPAPPGPSIARRLLQSLVLCAALFTLLVVGLAAIEAQRFFRSLNESIRLTGGPEYLAEPMVDQVVDRLVEAGFGRLPLDPREPMLAQRQVLICEGINERVAARVVERLLLLDQRDPGAPIDLYVATPGGWPDSAFVIVDTIRSLRSPVNTIATGGCYSAGTLILAAGTGKRVVTPGTLLSVHINDYRPNGEHDLDAHELARFQRLYEQYSNLPGVWFDTPGDNQYYLDAQQAVALGLADEVAEPHHSAPERRPRQESGLPPAA